MLLRSSLLLLRSTSRRDATRRPFECYTFTYVTCYCAAAAQQGDRIPYTLILHAAAAAAAPEGERIPCTLILHASIALYWVLLCSIGCIA